MLHDGSCDLSVDHCHINRSQRLLKLHHISHFEIRWCYEAFFRQLFRLRATGVHHLSLDLSWILIPTRLVEVLRHLPLIVQHLRQCRLPIHTDDALAPGVHADNEARFSLVGDDDD